MKSNYKQNKIEEFDKQYKILKREIILANNGNTYASDSLPLYERDFKNFLSETIDDLQSKFEDFEKQIDNSSIGHISKQAFNNLKSHLKVWKNKNL